MKIYLTLLIFGARFMACSVSGMTPEWRQEKIHTIENSRNLPRDERILLLGKFVRIGVHRAGSPAPPNEFQREVYEKARGLLLSTPGYAGYYGDRIKAARKSLDATPQDSQEFGHIQGKLRNEQSAGFEILSQLPSAETVRVLGEFLYDDVGWNDAEGEDNLLEQANSRKAAQALTQLPIVSKPIQRKPGEPVYYEDVEPWKLWYEQVKAGNRTFQFEGDPKHYNLEGPVAKAIEPASLARPRKDGPAEDSSPVAAEEPSRFPAGVLAAAVALLGAAVWFAMTRGRDAGVKGRSS